MDEIIANKKVFEFIKGRKSWHAFIDNIKKSDRNNKGKLKFLLGGRLEDTYSSAFFWSNTEQKGVFWNEEDRNLLMWFLEQTDIEKYNICIKR